MGTPKETSTTPFNDGNMSSSPERLNLYLKLIAENPLMHLALPLLRDGGARDKSGISIEPVNGVVKIVKRTEEGQGFSNISEHNMNVALVVNELSNLSGLDTSTRHLATAAGSVHDATKQIEISLISFPIFMANPNTSSEERLQAEQIIQDKLKRLGVDDRISIHDIKRAAGEGMLTYLQMMDRINKLFFGDRLANADLTDRQKHAMLELSGADSFGSLDKLIARVRRITKNAQENDSIREFNTYADAVTPKLPEVEDDGLDFSIALVWASDYMVTGIKLEASTDARIDALIQKGEYKLLDNDWAMRMKEGGKTQFEATRLAVREVEAIIRQKAEEQGEIDASNTRTIPQIVLDRLRQKSKQKE